MGRAERRPGRRESTGYTVDGRAERGCNPPASLQVLGDLTQFAATKGVRLVHDVIVGTKDISLVYGFNLATRSMAEADEIA
jgi:hypothetical protein